MLQLSALFGTPNVRGTTGAQPVFMKWQGENSPQCPTLLLGMCNRAEGFKRVNIHNVRNV